MRTLGQLVVFMTPLRAHWTRAGGDRALMPTVDIGSRLPSMSLRLCHNKSSVTLALMASLRSGPRKNAALTYKGPDEFLTVT